MKPKILLFGRNGQVGGELAKLLPVVGDLTTLDRLQLDLSKPAQIRTVIRDLQPRVIVNAAAYTQVDNAEKEENVARLINTEAPAVMAEEAKRIGALLIHYSTDYVFDGSKNSPYEEQDATNPISAYGRTKLDGERAVQAIAPAHLIFRTAWIYSRSGRNFLLTILRLATEREELRIVADQFGAPTWSREVARATTTVLSRLLEESQDSIAAKREIFHMTAAGQTSWFDFSQAILQEAMHLPPGDPWLQLLTKGRPIITRCIAPITSAEYMTPARRPAYSVLSNARLQQEFSVQLLDWRSQLREVFATRAEEFHTL